MSGRVTCLLVLLLVGPTSAGLLAQPSSRLGPWSDTPLGDPANDPESWNYTNRITWGTVVSVGKDGLTLHRPAAKVVRLRHDPFNGELLEEKELETRTAVPSKTFLLGAELAWGEYVRNPTRESYIYRSTDVRRGDEVGIEYDRLNGVDICRAISINRRWGGRIPPAPGEKLDAFRKYHEGRNAWQDWEQSRIPLPRKYCDTYRGDDGKFYPCHYPPESLQIDIVPTE